MWSWPWAGQLPLCFRWNAVAKIAAVFQLGEWLQACDTLVFLSRPYLLKQKPVCDQKLLFNQGYRHDLAKVRDRMTGRQGQIHSLSQRRSNTFPFFVKFLWGIEVAKIEVIKMHVNRKLRASIWLCNRIWSDPPSSDWIILQQVWLTKRYNENRASFPLLTFIKETGLKGGRNKKMTDCINWFNKLDRHWFENSDN